MENKVDFSRRTFFKSATAATIAAVPVLAANDRLNVAWIGTGTRGYYLMQRYLAGGNKSRADIVAVCDAYKGNLAKAKDLVQTEYGKAPKTYEDYRQLLADPSIDAVVIASPEHLHYPMFMAAIKAGKNIYVEKPL